MADRDYRIVTNGNTFRVQRRMMTGAMGFAGYLSWWGSWRDLGGPICFRGHKDRPLPFTWVVTSYQTLDAAQVGLEETRDADDRRDARLKGPWREVLQSAAKTKGEA